MPSDLSDTINVYIILLHELKLDGKLFHSARDWKVSEKHQLTALLALTSFPLK